MKNYFYNRRERDIYNQLIGLKELMSFFRKECGVYSFLTYGTLLGAIRGKTMVPFDTDYDIAYFSKGKTIQEIRDEWKKICTILIKNKMLGKIWVKGGSIIHPTVDDLKDFAGQMHVQTPNRKIYIDVYSSFCLGSEFHMSYGIHGHLKRSDIVPFGYAYLREFKFVVPKNPEAILKFMYGEDWKTPKEGYKYKGKYKKVWQY